MMENLSGYDNLGCSEQRGLNEHRGDRIYMLETEVGKAPAKEDLRPSYVNDSVGPR